MSVASLPLEQQSAEWRQRVELAACYRLLAHYKMTDLIYTHATVRVPGEPGHFLINPYGRRWEEITASSLVKIDLDGRKIGDSPHRVNPAGFTIHSAVHTARHDAACVIHSYAGGHGGLGHKGRLAADQPDCVAVLWPSRNSRL
jgi:ribulose-5-phosphate 4-epimerase/fuculose-1-phosphate aldolase